MKTRSDGGAADENTKRPKYDFSQRKRGVTTQRYAQGANLVVISPDVPQRVFRRRGGQRSPSGAGSCRETLPNGGVLAVLDLVRTDCETGRLKEGWASPNA